VRENDQTYSSGFSRFPTRIWTSHQDRRRQRYVAHVCEVSARGAGSAAGPKACPKRPPTRVPKLSCDRRRLWLRLSRSTAFSSNVLAHQSRPRFSLCNCSTVALCPTARLVTRTIVPFENSSASCSARGRRYRRLEFTVARIRPGQSRRPRGLGLQVARLESPSLRFLLRPACPSVF
jgi:hypothetical protein